MKFLVIPGLAKAGTTFLFDQLSRNETLFNPTKGKEINYFPKGTSIDDYTNYFTEKESDKIYLDATPQYLQSDLGVLDNMAKTLDGHDVKVIICLREPFQQIFSHYLHDLKRHIAHFDLRDRMLLSHNIMCQNALEKYLRPRAPAVRKLVKLFGRDNVLSFDLQRSFAAWGERRILEDFLGVSAPIRLETGRVSNAGGWIPRLHYHPTRFTEVVDNGHVYALPPRCLLVRNGTDSVLLKDVAPALAEVALRWAQTWSTEFRPADLGAVAGHLEEDYREVLRLLGEDDANLGIKDVYRANEPTLNADVVQSLRRIGSVQQRAEAAWRSQMDGHPEAQPMGIELGIRHSYGYFKHQLETATRTGGESERLLWIERLLEEFELSPKWLNSLLVGYIDQGRAQDALEYLQQRPYLTRFLKKPLLRARLNRQKKFTKPEVFEAMIQLVKAD